MHPLNTRYLLIQLCVVACLLAGAVSCSGGDDDDGAATAAPTADLPSPALDRSSTPLKIVVSLPIFADFARIIGGNQIQVTALVPPGVDPHTYVPGDDLAAAVTEADIIFYNGLDLEGPTQRFIEQNLAPRPPLIVDFVRNVPSPSTQQPVDRPIYARERGDDPHLFLDPVLVTVYPETVTHSIIIKDGANTEYYEARYQAYRQQLSALNGAIADKLSVIPPQNKALLITQHNSLIWFARRYGLSVAGTLEDDGAEGLAEIIASKKPPALFRESGFDPTALEALAEQANTGTCGIDTDNVAEAETSYLEMMEQTADEIARCLG